MKKLIKNISVDNLSEPGCVKFSWENPDKEFIDNNMSIVIVRRTDRFPTISIPPQRGNTISYDGDKIFNESITCNQPCKDKGLTSEKHYYYTFYTKYVDSNTSIVYHEASRNTQVIALVTAIYNNSQKLCRLLPGIYKKYDAINKSSEEEKGKLERFLELFGGQLDYIQSMISVAYKNNDLDFTDGSLL